MPAMPPSEYLTLCRPRCALRPTRYSDCEGNNPLERLVVNNTKGLVVPRGRTDLFSNSFPRTTLRWNHLEERVVSVDTVDQFKAAVGLQ